MVQPEGHRWQYNMVHVLCMLCNYSYRQTLRLCTTYCFSMTTMFMPMCLNVHTYIHTVHVLLSTKRTTQLPTTKTLPAEAAYFTNKLHSVFCKIKICILQWLWKLLQGFIKFRLTSNEKYVTLEVLTAVFIKI